MTVHDTLTRARALIAQPETWTQNAYARDSDGTPIVSNSPDAVCWCLTGAIYRVITPGSYLGNPDYLAATDALSDALPAHVTSEDLTVWNDTPRRTHQQILNLLDRAIAKAAS